jgi:hypothetical protein
MPKMSARCGDYIGKNQKHAVRVSYAGLRRCTELAVIVDQIRRAIRNRPKELDEALYPVVFIQRGEGRT